MVRPSIGYAVVLALTLGSTGCVTTETVPVLYRVPLRENSHGAEAAKSCVAACSVAHARDANGFYGCLSTCPDAEIRDGAACTTASWDTPPESYCYTRETHVEKPDPRGMAVFLTVLKGVTEATVATATVVRRANGHSRRCSH